MEDIIEVKHELFEAKILLQGAQLIYFKPKNEEQILWSTDLKYFQKGKPFRGGIPICWPWFGKNKSPSHGFARLVDWKLTLLKESTDNVVLEFLLDSDMYQPEYFKNKYRLKLQMILSREINLRLLIDSDVETTGALHSYFFFSDVTKTRVEGLGTEYFDSLKTKSYKDNSEYLVIDQEIDRIYEYTKINRIISNVKTLEIDNLCASDVVVWNPWEETSNKINDMENNEYLKMLCIETANISLPIKRGEIALKVSQKENEK